MPESFGARLRQRREQQGISLITVAERTKIKHALLESLERDDVSQWPTGFYRRAFVRAYASAIDLDPDAVLREFFELYPEPPEVDVLVAMASALERTQCLRPGSGIRTVVGSAIGSLARLRRPAHGDEPPVSEPPPQVNLPAPVAVSAPTADEPVPAPASVRTIADEMKHAEPVVAIAPTVAPPAEPDLAAVARLCTELGSARDEHELESLLHDVAAVLDATGLIVWHWDAVSSRLRATLVHGYSPRVLAQLPALRPDADNATATAFRTARPCIVGDTPDARSAVVVPLITPEGCGGVFAIELQRGREQSESIVAIATIFAAVLAQSQLAPVEESSEYEERHYVSEGLAR